MQINKNPPKISIIMPCYNEADLIARSIASALNQSFDQIELIVVDDGSTDRCLQVLEGIRDARLRIISQHHRGVCSARNRGLAEATGNYIAFLDADDSWRPDCLEKLYGALQAQSDASLAYCGWQNVGLPSGRGKPFVPPDYECPDKVEILLRDCPWPIHAALTRYDYIEQAGGFDERFPTSEDYFLWLRIVIYHKIVRVPEVLSFYHHHKGPQATKNRVQMAFNHWQVKREFLKQHPEIAGKLGRSRIRELIYGKLLKQGYICYWDRDLEAARAIFRAVMKSGYGTLSDWKYMLPCLLPTQWHFALVDAVDQSHGDPK